MYFTKGCDMVWLHSFIHSQTHFFAYTPNKDDGEQSKSVVLEGIEI